MGNCWCIRGLVHSRARWRSFDKLLGRPTVDGNPKIDPSVFVSIDDYIHSFKSKVENIRSSTASANQPVIYPCTVECILSDFAPVSHPV